MAANLAAPDDAQLVSRANWAEATRAGRLMAVAESLLGRSTVNPAANRERVLRMAAETGSVCFLAQNKALAGRGELTGRLAATGLPVLLLCGAEDEVCPVERQRVTLERIATATLAVVPAAGHLATLDRPQAVRDALAGWCTGPLPVDPPGSFA